MSLRKPPARSSAPRWAAALLLAAAASASAAEPGAGVFMAECAECHSVAKGKNKRGPSLFGVVGRPAATVAGYKYSGALSQTGWTWDEATLRRYLAQPSDTALTGTKMEYEGLKDARQLDALIGYLRSRR
ncbi:c-type cytochrome [Lysobacter enzymogenes]|uniref:Cytochrome c family protein n=1 Tax=Lysobacter enzymogenes TaxID=69 RepID=A0A3N2RHP3_LYSEN|nr:c-type cytochrome [Lysobacter enzymogenes]ROU06987.1 cytochrome c family protein [Lysobacter enzymogenes]